VLKKIVKQQGDAAEVGETLAIIDDSETVQAASKDDHAEDVKSEEEEPAEPAREERDQDAAKVKASKAAPARRASGSGKDNGRAKGEQDESPGSAAKAPESKPAKGPARTEEPGVADAPPFAERRPGKSPRDQRADEALEEVDRVPMTPVRRRIAERLVWAQQEAALLTTFNEVDMTAVKELRDKHGEAFAERHRVRLGFMSFFVKAAVAALQEFPEVNAAIDDDQIVYHRYHNIGVAVSTPKGLVVPTIKHADAMSLAEIEEAIEDLAGRAREGRLRVEDLQGGTFTITNGGVFGSLLSTPLVNPPQSGVLGMHAIQDRPVAVDGQVVIKPMMYLALTYDHRLVDGEQAVKFLKRIAEDIADPLRLWLGV
jgi:2-oxoglutarate dehydrogenase E2 component (dihydrolipoamide succinyltransferase)